MKAVVDTKVLISATIVPQGNPASILAAWRSSQFELVISADLISELAQTLAYPRVRRRNGWTDALDRALVEELRENAYLATPEYEINILEADPADNRVLEAAVAGEVDYLVTGDALLLKLREYEGTQIVTPAQFLAIIHAERL